MGYGRTDELRCLVEFCRTSRPCSTCATPGGKGHSLPMEGHQWTLEHQRAQSFSRQREPGLRKYGGAIGQQIRGWSSSDTRRRSLVGEHRWVPTTCGHPDILAEGCSGNKRVEYPLSMAFLLSWSLLHSVAIKGWQCNSAVSLPLPAESGMQPQEFWLCLPQVKSKSLPLWCCLYRCWACGICRWKLKSVGRIAHQSVKLLPVHLIREN